MKAPVELDQIADLVLNYRPKPKSKASSSGRISRFTSGFTPCICW